MRKKAREAVYKLIFEYLFLKESETEQFVSVLESKDFSDTDKQYIREVLEGVTKNFDLLIKIIESTNSTFNVSRMFKSDLAVLLLAVYEIEFMRDIPPLVSINEAIELSKIYGTEKSPSFINGVLAAVKNKKEQ